MMMMNKEMNQRIGGNPLTLKRHIIIDNIQKIIYIQVMYKFDGSINQQEFYDLKMGSWHKYVPLDIAAKLQAAIGSGYTMRPYHANAIANEEFFVLQIADMGVNLQLGITK